MPRRNKKIKKTLLPELKEKSNYNKEIQVKILELGQTKETEGGKIPYKILKVEDSEGNQERLDLWREDTKIELKEGDWIIVENPYKKTDEYEGKPAITLSPSKFGGKVTKK